MPDEDKPKTTSEENPTRSAKNNLEEHTAYFRKITIPSYDTQQYSTTGVAMPTPDTASGGISITDLVYVYLTNAIAHKAINLRANRVLGGGFSLLPSDEPGIDPELANAAKNECGAFLKKINYRTFFRQAIINAYTAGNEWTEAIYNKLGHMVGTSHGDFYTLDFRRNFINNKILLDDNGEPVGYWQYIADLSQLYYSLSSYYGEVMSYENMQAAKLRLEASRSLEIKDEHGNPVAVMTTKPNYMFLKKDEIVHLSFNNANDNYYGVSLLIPAWNALNHLEQVMYAVAEAVNDMGYPKPDVSVGDETHNADQKLLDAAQSMIQDPVRKEGFVHPYYMKISYLQPNGMGNGNIGDVPEWFFTETAIGLRTPKELLTGAGDSNRATSVQAANDFDRDMLADRAQFEEYVLRILDLFLKSRGYKTTGNEKCPYLPKLTWEAMITEDEALRQKMTLEQWNANLVTFNEAREMLKLDEIEDPSRGDAYLSELGAQQPSQATAGAEQMPIDETGTVRAESPVSGQLPEQAEMHESQSEPAPEANVGAQTAQFAKALGTEADRNPSLNRQFGTEGVDYEKVARKNVGTKIRSVDKATAKGIRDIIVNDEAAKKSAKTIMRKVQEAGGYTKAEAQRVLVTEHKNLEEHGSLENAMKKGMKFKKWNSKLDKDTSPLCRALDGKVVPIDKEFEVRYKDEQGKEQMWKGKAPAAHPFCRSYLTYQNEEK